MSAPATASDARREEIRAEAIRDMEGMRTAMRERGASTPAFEKFVDEVVLLISVHVDPAEAIDTVFSVITGKRVAVRS
ncbi:hypothetical protein ABZS88_11265 [Streptomyces sp. NPDC005480]|uniref:hypothetical protein n=1 Tax=Streptomyces sp. NPDC005480 TaxID=3154880 RepID=UPI0033BA1BA8